jgi:competence protein ComEC
MQALRERVRDHIARELTNPRLAALVAALSMGDQNAIEQADWDVFRRTGVAHLVSISGMHVTLLALWLATVLRWLWCRLSWRGQPLALYWPAPLVAMWFALPMALGYAWFSGWGLPAQRTVWMLLATAILHALNAHWPPHAAWLGLVALVATFDPLALSQPGFWLSYVAVGVLYAMQSGSAPGRLGQWLGETIDLQWRITLALAPMSLLFFHGVSLAGGWVNIWAIPWVTWVLTPLSLLGMFLPPIWGMAGWAADGFLRGLEWAASSQWAMLETAPPSVASTVLGTVLAARAVCPGHRGWRLGAALCLGLWFYGR